MNRKRRGCLTGCLAAAGICSLVIGILLMVLVGLGLFEGIREGLTVSYMETSDDESLYENCYYYHQLAEEEQLVYREILAGIQDNTEEINVHSQDPKRVNELYQFVLNDFPEIFWIDGTAETTSYELFDEHYCTIQVNYTYEGEEKEQKKQQVEEAAGTCLDGLPEDAGEYEKIKYVYEYVINTTEYDETASDNQNIYSVLVNRRSVCAGYARTMQYLLNREGVFCTYVTGITFDGSEGIIAQSHAWNLVQCDGEYYYVDATWGDPVFTEEEDGETISYDYLCCSDEELFRTHSLDSDLVVPECTSTTYNYYVLNGGYYDSVDRDVLLQDMKEGIQNRETEIPFKFANYDLYSEALDLMEDELFEEAAQYLGKKYHLGMIYYSYSTDAVMNKIVVKWQYE